MKFVVVLFIAACAMASPLYVRERRSVDEANLNTTTTRICASTTPCAWSMYNADNHDIYEYTISNSYCICETGLECAITEKDTNTRTFIYHCRPPQPDSKGH